MTRDEAKKILGEGATEEVITNFLNNYHIEESAKVKDLETKVNNLTQENSKYSDYDSIKKQLDDINKANMTEQQKLDQMLKDAEADRKMARLEVSRAKAKSILAEVNITDEQIEDLVSDNLDDTIAKANRWKQTITNLKDTVAKETKETLMNQDLKPSMSNVNQNENAMTFDKFNTLSAEEQAKWVAENPNGLNNLN